MSHVNLFLNPPESMLQGCTLSDTTSLAHFPKASVLFPGHGVVCFKTHC